MPFIITTPTSIPANLDTSHASPTWGEAGGPFPPSAFEDPGFGAVALTSNDLNYNTQHASRWLRAIRDRVVMADEGLFTTCVVKKGTWNVNGGTLGATLTPTRVVVDVDANGGTVIEIKAAAGDPEVLPASSDSYLDLDELGGYAVVSVPAGDPEPPVTPGMVRIYKVTTDAIEITSADVVSVVAQFPCLGPIVGALTLQAGTLSASTASASTLTVSGLTTLEGPVEAQADVELGGVVTQLAPVYAQTHAVAGDWRDSFRPSKRTFVAFGVVAPGGQTIRTQITTPTGSDALFAIQDLTPTTNSAFVTFGVVMMIAWSGDGNPPTGAAGLKTAVEWTATALYNNGTWNSVTNGTQKTTGAALGGSAVAIVLDGGSLKIEVAHDLGVENRGYRWGAEVTGYILEMAT